MSDYKVKVWASINMLGGKAEETVDLVEDMGWSEEDANAYCEALKNETFPEKWQDEELRDRAATAIGYDWGCYLTDDDE